jgi:UDP-N-acetylmuramate-alanine ligase
VLEFWDEFASVMNSFDESIVYDIYTAREDLDHLLEQFPIKHETTINSIDTLGNLFAKDCNALYTDDFEIVTNRIEHSKVEEVICIFSAGNLDFKIRNYIAAH